MRLSECYGYSDSYYDLPLLESVGHPHAVNPDPRLQVVAAGRRWPIVHLDIAPGIPKFMGIEPRRLVMMLFSRTKYYTGVRFDFDGVDRIPQDGPGIVVGNHRSYFDPVALGMLLANTRGAPFASSEKEVFDAPLVGDLATAMGGIHVERGSGDDEPLLAAEQALRIGELVALMPQGTIPAGQRSSTRCFGAGGVLRSWLPASRAPVIPVGIWGTERVWPRSSRVPNLMNILNPPTVHLRVGEPVELKYRSVDADTKRIMSAISALLPEHLRTAQHPTDEELARTYPSGWDPDKATDDTKRRPGED